MDKKNIFEKNKFDRKKLIYYSLAAVCILAIAAISFISYKSVQNSLSESRIENSIDNVDKVDVQKDDVPVTDSALTEETVTEPDKSSQQQITVDSKAYIMPVDGEITNIFSLTEPIYSETLKDWRIHDGVDIAASIGDSVVAVNDGAVESVKSDDLYGITVIITHTDGRKSVYCNLDDSVELEEGQIINQGDIVGKVGDSAVFEISDSPHLHFEMTENGKKTDPLKILKVQE